MREDGNTMQGLSRTDYLQSRVFRFLDASRFLFFLIPFLSGVRGRSPRLPPLKTAEQ